MPVKNTEKYLMACLHSILNQTYEDWELIAVDDHSSDNSRAILEQVKDSDNKNRIKVFRNKGTGIIAALRTAYAQATGKYITRMDSDDIMTNSKLELLTRRLEQTGPAHIVTALVEYFNDKGTIVGEGYRKYAAWLNHLTSTESNYSEIYKECPIASPNWMVYRKDLEDADAFRPNVYPEDYDLCFRFREANLTITSINTVTHYWRDYPSRTSRTDENYRDNKFTHLKVKYFLQSDYDKTKQLVLWGAGPKGKSIAKELNSKGIQFVWITNNTNKIGKDIYGTIVQSIELTLKTKASKQYIIAISQYGTQDGIKKQLEDSNQNDFYFFC